MKLGRDIQAFATEVDRQRREKHDYRVRMNCVSMSQDGKLKFDNEYYGIGEIAAQHLSTYTKIPFNYFKRLQQESPELLSTNVNYWLEKDEGKRLVRVLDGNVRAVLSPRYRIIDNYEIAETILPILNDSKMKVTSCEITDKRMYIKAVGERKKDVSLNDVVQQGVVVSNSEVGLGMVRVQPLIYRLICTNGMIANTNSEASMRRRHLGPRYNDIGAMFEELSDKAIKANNQALLLTLRDVVKNATDEILFDKIVDSLKESKEKKITSRNIPAVVEEVGKKFGISEVEQRGVLDHLIRGNDLSLYGLANAFTRHSQDLDNYDRATDFESLGWDVINMTENELRRLNAVA